MCPYASEGSAAAEVAGVTLYVDAPPAAAEPEPEVTAAPPAAVGRGARSLTLTRKHHPGFQSLIVENDDSAFNLKPALLFFLLVLLPPLYSNDPGLKAPGFKSLT